jgi:NodT family efflux transporter outer membrane factor (OMF) lipoprotein
MSRIWIVRRAPGLALCAGLAGCAMVGPNFHTPEAPASAGYVMRDEASPSLARLTPDARSPGPWWTALGSTLDTVMSQALAGNQTVAAADAALAKAQAQAQSVRGGLDPRLDGTASAERERINFQTFGFPNIANPTLNAYQIGGAVSYDIDLFGGAHRRLEVANAAAQALGWRADAAYLSLTGNVALQAVRIAGLRAQATAVREILEDDQRNIDLIHAAEAAGGEPRAATSGGRAQQAADEALLPSIDRQLAVARHALALLVGKSPAEWSAPDFDFTGFNPPAEIPVELPSQLARNRPDILAAEAEFHADTARIGVAVANLYPDVRLTAGLAQGALTPGSLFSYNSTGWYFGPSATFPLLNGGSLRADKRAAEAQARVSFAQYRQTVLTAFAQIADVLTALAHDEDQFRAVLDAQSAAQSALDDARNAYRLGGGPLLAVIDAQRRLDRARLGLVEARGQRLADMVTLFAATARDWRPGAKMRTGV